MCTKAETTGPCMVYILDRVFTTAVTVYKCYMIEDVTLKLCTLEIRSIVGRLPICDSLYQGLTIAM